MVEPSAWSETLRIHYMELKDETVTYRVGVHSEYWNPLHGVESPQIWVARYSPQRLGNPLHGVESA